MTNLGLWRLIKIGFAYAWAAMFQRKPERHLEDFFINRFGTELYRTFFKDYTEKVWGVPCNEISPDWGAQRIKGLSIIGALKHAASKLFSRSGADVAQKGTNTSLIERFMYPKFGPGQMWQVVAEEVKASGGEIHHGHRVVKVSLEADKITAVETEDRQGKRHTWAGDWLISTMAIRDLMQACTPPPPVEAAAVANGLCYRDFITMGLLVKKLKPTRDGEGATNLVPDTWIYIQEPDVNIGRLQIFNNWSPALVAREDAVWMGLEYFCQEGDELWSMTDESFAKFAIDELAKIELIDPADAIDWHVVRVPKAYPAYFGSYDQFDKLRAYTDAISNLFLVGRNGMHRYNNQDHSMLTAKLAVDAILANSPDKSPLWDINVDDDYHEEKKGG